MTITEIRKLKRAFKPVKGDTGDQGEKGIQGIQGIAGKDGKDGLNGLNGKDGKNGINGKDGKDGKDGKSIIGPKGKDGVDGKDGKPGKDGKDGDQIKPVEIVEKLESLIGNKRLDASAIKNLDKKLKDSKLSLTGFGGGSGGSSTFKELTDTPEAYTSSANKFVKVNSDETGLEFTDSTATVAWGGITGTLTNQLDLQTELNKKIETESDPVFTASEASSFVTGDKLKLDGIEANANNYVLESHDNTKHSTNYEEAFTKNTAFNKNFGALINTVTQGNDARLSDDRTPLEHGNEKHSATFITAADVPTNADFDLADLGDVTKTAKAEGKILKVDALGNHVYVTDETGTDEKVKYDSLDPTAGYVSDKVIAGDGITVAEGTVANENKLEITNADKGSSAVTTHESAFVHGDIAHSNRTALDAVTNINTGDQDLSAYAIDEDVKKFAGFENRTDSTIAMVGNNFEITTATNYNIHIRGEGKLNITTTKSIEITDDQTITYIYFDYFGGDVRINKSTSSWHLTNGTAVPVAIVFKDGASYAITDERHGYNRSLEWHSWAHQNIGALYNSGLAGTFTATTLSITQGIIYDEDIRADTGGTKTTTSLWYRNATDGMRIIRGSTTPYSYIGANIQWDNGSGILQEVGNNNYYVSWVYATNDPAEPIYTVIGQGNHANLNDARDEEQPIINLTTAEWKLLYKVIYRNTPTPTYIEGQDFRSVQTGVAVQTVSPTSHSILTDRDATGSHPATAISNTPAGNIEAITVQAAIDELDTEKLSDITGESVGDLSDVDLTSVADNKILKWNTNKFVIADDENTTYQSSDFNHDSLTGFVANEHIDWTAPSAGTINATNYVDNDTTYTAADFNLADLGDVVNTAKAENKILKVDALGKHVYVDDESGTDEKVKFDSEDPTAGYVTDKVIAGDGISVAEGTGGNTNKLVVTNTDKGSDVSVPVAATEAPSNHGVAAVGTSTKYARENHVHNTDNTDTTYTAGTGLTLTGTQFTSNDSQINHNSLSNTHNLTTDIDHNVLTNYAVGEHRAINDLATGTTDLWSASKINSELGGKLANIESESIGDLIDVDLATIATGDLLQWNGTKFIKYTFSATGTQVPLS